MWPRPGGWLLLEEWDAVTAEHVEFGADAAEQALVRRVIKAFEDHNLANGTDPLHNYTGRQLPGWLRAAGLTHIGAQGRTVVVTGGTGPDSSPLQHPHIREAVAARGAWRRLRRGWRCVSGRTGPTSAR